MDKNKRFSKLDSGLKGGLQGATLGFSDELGGAVQGGLDKSQELLNKLGLVDKSPSQINQQLAEQGFSGDLGPKSSSDIYSQTRDEDREENKLAEEQNPGSYMAGQVAGSVLPAMIGSAAAPKLASSSLAKMNALEGLARGIGSSTSSSVEDIGTDALKNLALDKVMGLGGGVVMKALPKSLKNKIGKVAMADKSSTKIVYPKGQPIIGQGEVQAAGKGLGKVNVVDDVEQALGKVKVLDDTPNADLGKIKILDDTPVESLGKTVLKEEPSELKSDAGKKIMEILGNKRTGDLSEEQAAQLIKQQHDRFRHLMK